MAKGQDATAPIGRDEINETVRRTNSTQDKANLVAKVLACLNEKRDAYNGVISSMSYMIDTVDEELISLLIDALYRNVAIEPMRYGGKIFVNRCLPRLIQEQPQFVGRFFSRIVLESRMRWENITVKNPSEILKLKTIALRAIGQAEQKAHATLTEITREEIDAICDEAIDVGDNSTKIDALYILLDTKQATRVFTEKELDIYKTVCREALNFQVPALRQRFLALTNKLLKRVRDSIRVVAREKERFPETDRECITKRYLRFLEWLIKFCLDNIYCNKYFGSFIITMTTLGYIIDHITLNNPNLPIEQLLDIRRFHDSILSCLALDSFEDNKVLALKLLFAVPDNLKSKYSENLDLFEQVAYELVNSVNPAHSMTCQYVFKLLINLEQNKSQHSKNTIVYKHLDRLVTLVENGVRITKSDLVTALKNNAIYPKLTCMRALLDEINIEDLEVYRTLWESLASRIVQTSIEACQAVSAFVCNMNPETIGHLPMDLKPIDVETLSKNLDRSAKISDEHISTVTSQHLLITGWKTIKECSLSMGALCSRLWWPQDNKHMSLGVPALGSNDVERIIEFFEHYLRNLRHRGAFEQAYNGFIMVTKRIWLEEKFRDLLIKNLGFILDDFKSDQDELDVQKVEYLKKHVTRRSAGLPFLIQAIAVSEDKQDTKIFQSIIETLITVMESDKSETFQKIHCLNILKALVNDFNLGEKVTPYLGKIFLITIDSFKSEDFPIRNCANMLMRALVDRTFGVNRLRDEIHKRNTMSFEKFFSQYPELHSKLERYLHVGSKDKRLFASVHAVLIILSHLRPSLNPSADYTIDKMVKPYTRPLHTLATACVDWRLRELSAKLYVQFTIYIKSDEKFADYWPFKDWSDEYIDSMARTCSENTQHGIMCILRNVLLHLNEIENKKCQEEICEIARSVIHKNMVSELSSYLEGFDRPIIGNSLTLPVYDLIESYCLVRPTDRFPIRQSPLASSERSPAIEGQDGYNLIKPHVENRVFASMTMALIAGNEDKTVVLTHMIEFITRKPDRLYSYNLQASLLRFVRQFYSNSESYVDKLLTNLDSDLTAAHMTPIDKLNERPELDSVRELWQRYCEQFELRHAIRNGLATEHLDRLFDLSQYDEFRAFSEDSTKNAIQANTPRAIELLAFICKAWDSFNLETRCIWQKRDETNADKLEFLVRFIRALPDCDLKCLVLLCASNIFKIELKNIHASGDILQPVNRSQATLQFTKILESLADGMHDRNIRNTCCEILNQSLRTAIDCTCKPLKSTQMNLISALIKLCQDEEYEIREAASNTIANLKPNRQSQQNSQTQRIASGSCLDNLIGFIVSNLLEPSNILDVKHCFDLLTRIIFEHSTSSSVDLSEDRESLFDKTKPNFFADHVTTIHNTLLAARTFFQSTKGPLPLENISLPHEMVESLSLLDRQKRVDHNIGDYSWRSKAVGQSSHETDQSPGCGLRYTNQQLIEQALENVKQNLRYFNYWNMLTDTSFGYHESSIFKRLAFVKLLLECTDYDNQSSMINEIRVELKNIIETACATTILFKCYELLES